MGDSSSNENDYIYMGFLGNVDSSILSVKLNHGFHVKSMSIDEYKNFKSEFKKSKLLGLRDIINEVISRDSNIVNFEEERIYFIKNSSENYQKYQEYPNSIILLLRLFAEGDILLPIQFTTTLIENGKLKDIHSSMYMLTYYIYHPRYSLKNIDTKNLNRFISKVQLPLKRSWLQLAIENLALSYKTTNKNLSFLSMMISLEALFNPGRYELTYRISRNAAVFLGGLKDMNSQTIFTDIKRLYEKRSSIVHGEKKNFIDENDLFRLRDYVRKSIRLIIDMDINRDDLLDHLNKSGFN
jgi:hypothetical protein